jgi:hypothetical protein
MISDVSVKPEFLLVLLGFVETVNKFILYEMCASQNTPAYINYQTV